MPFYKVPSPSSTSLSDLKNARVPSRQSHPASPDPPSSTTDSSFSGSNSIHNFGGFSDEEAGYVNGRGWTNRTEDPHYNHQKERGGASSGSRYASEVNGNRNLSVPEQQVSIVELEIQQQSEREAELLAMHQSLYRQKLPQNLNREGSSSLESPSRGSGGTVPQQNNSSLPPPVHSPASASSSSSSSSMSVVSYEEAISTRSHPGENLIAREIMELKQREEELRLRRRELGVEPRDYSTDHHVRTPLSLSTSSKPDQSSIPVDGFHSIPDHDRAARGVTGTPSPDERPGKKMSRIRPLESLDPEAAASQFLPQEETPIGKEMRLAREREDALRQARGLPSVPDAQATVVEVEVAGGTLGAVDRKTDQTMKKLASSRLMVEIEKEKQRELEVRRHWQGKQQMNASAAGIDSRQNPAKSSSYNRRY